MAPEASASASTDTAGVPNFPDLTKSQVRYTAIVAFLAWTMAVYDLITFGNILPAIQKSFGWSDSTASFVATFVSFGSLVVALAVGPMIDFLGRRTALFVTTGGAALSSGLAALAFNPLSMAIVRSLSGFGMSEQAVNSAYLNEVFGAQRKGFFYGMVQAGWPVGVMLSAGLAATFSDTLGWRGVFAVATFPLIIIFFLRMGLKESPYFLKLQHLRKMRKDGQLTASEQLGSRWNIDIAGDRKNTYAELFSPALRKHSTAVGLMFFFKIIGDVQMTVLATSILAQSKGIELNGALWTVVFGNAVAILGYLLFGWLGDKIGRRDTVIIAQVLAAVCTLLLLFVAQGFTAVVALYSLVLFFAQGAAAPFFAYVGESYPTRIRGTGAAFIGITGPIGGTVGLAIYGSLVGSGYSSAVAASSGAIAAVLSALCLFAARKVPPRRDIGEVSH
ncbi:MAG TPA: MFS transporter [Magnetospirillaceae bacterium]|jgi:MFS family permease